MLVVRAAQMRALQERARRSYEIEMVAHLAQFSPPLFKAVGEQQMGQAVQFGVARAATRGLTFRGPVRLYLELMLLFGSYFDTDPQYPWASQILSDQTREAQMDRARRLQQATKAYRRDVAGPEDAYTIDALRRIAHVARHLVTIPDDVDGFILREISYIYPQKAAYLGSDGLARLLQRSAKETALKGMATPRGRALMTVLMLAFGHGCADNPLYPWISHTLARQTPPEAEARANRLEKKALTWLDHVLTNFEGAPPA